MSSQQLCLLCSQIDLDLFRPDLSTHKIYSSSLKEQETWSWKFADVLESVETQDCELCALIIETIEVSDRKREEFLFATCTFEIHDVGSMEQYSRYYGPMVRNKESGPRTRLRRLYVTLTTTAKNRKKLPTPRCSVSPSFTFALHAGAGLDLQSSDQKIWGLARQRPVWCNFDLLNSWLSNCNATHCNGVCDKERLLTTVSRQFEQSPFTIRLVDVMRRCIIEVPSQDVGSYGYKYAALSYVWGTDTQPLGLTRENKEVLYTAGGIQAPSKTVEDAMTVAKKMGYEYLWVDVLCVLQNDDTEKLNDIAHMYEIYTRADLTIIAAGHGTSADGLPGIGSPRPPQTSRQVTDSLWLYSCSQSLLLTSNGIAMNVPWSSRGWTLQEQVLSRRCIFFLEDTVIWRCQLCDRFEDFILEKTDVKSPHLLVKWRGYGESKRRSILQQRQTAHEAEMFHIENPRTFERNFQAIVEAYTKRTLTKNTDIQHAFGGIMVGLEKSFYFGIPCKRFEEYLCWERKADRRELLEIRRDSGVPSWSWMAWKGPVSYSAATMHTEGYGDRKCLWPVIVCYRSKSTLPATASPELQPVTDERFSDVGPRGYVRDEDIETSIVRYADRAWKSLRETQNFQEVQLPQLSGKDLVFWADVAQLDVQVTSCQTAGKYPDDDAGRNKLRTLSMVVYEVIGPDGDVLMRSKGLAIPNADTLPRQKRQCSFFAVAKHVFSIAYKSEEPKFFTTAYSVMMVSLDELGIGKRENIFVVKRTLWDAIPQKRRVIVLE